MELFITCDLLGVFILFFRLEYSSNYFYRAGLVVINSFNLFLSWNDFIYPSILIVWLSIMFGWTIFVFHNLEYKLQSPKFLLNNQEICLCACLCKCHGLSVLQMLIPLFCVLSVLIIIFCEVVLFWPCLFGVLWASCTWMGISFSGFEKLCSLIFVLFWRPALNM